MSTRWTVGTRGSKLAMRQTELVVSALRHACSENDFTINTISTEGDRRLNVDLRAIGGKGVFVKEIERELLNGDIDFAVHSLKDMAPQLPEGLVIGCVPHRASPFDCLVSPTPFVSIDDLPLGARIGTNSLRRQGQLLHRRPDLHIVPIRGNVETRLRKITTEHLDAAVLAEAGLQRLGIDAQSLRESGLHTLPLNDTILPAAGQGAMAVECRADDTRTLNLLASIDDPSTRLHVTIERAFMQRLGGSCSFPIGAYARANQITGTSIAFDGLVASPEGEDLFRKHRVWHPTLANANERADINSAAAFGRVVADTIISDGALTIIS